MSENGHDGGPSDGFNSASVSPPDPEPPVQDFPSGQDLLDDGIKHDSAYDAWAAQGPDNPENNFDGPNLGDWSAAGEQAHADHVATVETYREEFYQEIHEHRVEFNDQAHDNGIDSQINDMGIGPDHDRE